MRKRGGNGHSNPQDGTPSRRAFLHSAAGASAALVPSMFSTNGTALAQTGSGVASANDAITPFKVNVAQAALGDLKSRLGRIRFPEKETVTDWSQGVPLRNAKAVTDYWRTQYDWRRFERTVNALPQFRTRIDGLNIHFLHVRSHHANALPILLTHGWPGSFVEFLEVVAPMTDPTAHGGKPQDAFDVVIPSLPGFGFSDKPTASGWRLPRIAAAWDVLMKRLGYRHYVAQGGDWGAGVTTWMGKQRPSGLAAIHLNLPVLFPPPPPGPGGYSDIEKATLAKLEKYGTDGIGYAAIQGTRPQTVGYALADSPAGQAMWIYEKFQAWSDTIGDPFAAIPLDRILDDITLYWLTDTAASSARLYRESFYTDFKRMELALPVAVSIFKGDFFTPPKVWGDRTYSSLVYWNDVPKGGHFAAFEQPALFVNEMRTSLRDFR
jgi:pimeloyl-ACP methyl ester carboxylesterase